MCVCNFLSSGLEVCVTLCALDTRNNAVYTSVLLRGMFWVQNNLVTLYNKVAFVNINELSVNNAFFKQYLIIFVNIS